MDNIAQIARDAWNRFDVYCHYTLWQLGWAPLQLAALEILLLPPLLMLIFVIELRSSMRYKPWWWAYNNFT